MKVIAINGSPNLDGNTAFLLDTVLGECERLGADVQRISVAPLLMQCKTPFCTVCSNPCNKSCYKGTPLEMVFEQLKTADAIVFGSPVYFGSITAQLKAFFDKTRALRGEKALLGKVCGVVSVGAQVYGGQQSTGRSIQDIAMVQGMTIVGDGNMDEHPGHHGVFCQQPARESERAINRCISLAKRLVYEVQK